MTQKHLAEQARKATFCLMKKVKQFGFNVTTMLELFDTYVAPVLNYGAEIWGTNKAPEIERVHTMYVKRVLGVKRSTSNAMVYNEVARMPQICTRYVRILKYWTKLITTNNCIVKAIYANMLTECERTRTGYNWLRNVKDTQCILYKLGMIDHWAKQDPGDTNTFI